MRLAIAMLLAMCGSASAAPTTQPVPAFPVGGTGFVLAQNWDFGTDAGQTVRNVSDLERHFQFHDQFNTIDNGGNYGARIVAPDAATALANVHQPIEGADTGGKPVRRFTQTSMKTFLVPLNGTKTVDPTKHNVGCGSFMSNFTLPKGGKLLGQDLLWETRVRYHTPPYFWFAIWAAGNKWDRGAEADVVESFGYDNGGGATNFDGRFWHANSVGGADRLPYRNWEADMHASGIDPFDATQWHVWTWLYRVDDTFAFYCDGVEVQSGTLHWTLHATPDGEPINMNFLFDAGWGHTQMGSVSHTLPASALADAYYECDYSRIFLRPAADSDHR